MVSTLKWYSTLYSTQIPVEGRQVLWWMCSGFLRAPRTGTFCALGSILSQTLWTKQKLVNLIVEIVKNLAGYHAKMLPCLWINFMALLVETKNHWNIWRLSYMNVFFPLIQNVHCIAWFCYCLVIISDRVQKAEITDTRVEEYMVKWMLIIPHILFSNILLVICMFPAQ